MVGIFVGLLGNVQFSHLNFQSQVCILLHGGLVQINGGITHGDVGLHAHAVDQVLFHQRFQNVADDVRLLVGRVLVVVIVEQLAACRCVLLGEFERQRNIGLVAVDLDPCRLPVHLVVGTRIANGAGIGSGFVHHVPCVEFHIGVILFQRFHDGLDVVFQTLGHLVLGNPCSVGIEVFLEEPVRCLAVPYQHMTAYRNFVFAGEFQHLVCFVQRDLGHGVIAGFCHVLLGQCQIQHAVRLQFVAQCQAVVVLFDEILVRIPNRHRHSRS